MGMGELLEWLTKKPSHLPLSSYYYDFYSQLHFS